MNENKLIAEFMGMELGDDKTVYYDDAENLHPPTPVNELQFHTSWDWLMPVVEKIEEIFIDDSNLIIKEHRYEFDMKHTQCEIYDHVRDCVVASGDMGSKILSTYQSVVEFIKEYNNN